MQVPTAQLEGGVDVETTSHGPLGFLSGTFRGQGGVRHRVHVSPLGVLAVVRSAHQH